jgi:hypothetical protein
MLVSGINMNTNTYFVVTRSLICILELLLIFEIKICWNLPKYITTSTPTGGAPRFAQTLHDARSAWPPSLCAHLQGEMLKEGCRDRGGTTEIRRCCSSPLVHGPQSLQEADWLWNRRLERLGDGDGLELIQFFLTMEIDLFGWWGSRSRAYLAQLKLVLKPAGG